MMRKIAWMFGFCCDVTVLVLVASLLYSTYQASVVEVPSHIPPEYRTTTPPEVVVPDKPMEPVQWPNAGLY